MKSVKLSAIEAEDRPRSVVRPKTGRRERPGALHGVAQPSKRTAVRHSYDLKLDDLSRSSRAELRKLWAQELGDKPPATLGRDVLALAIAYARQERLYGGLSKPVARELDRLLDRLLREGCSTKGVAAPATPLPRTGTVLVREWQGTTHHVTIVNDGFVWNGETYRSLSSIAHAITGTKWNGPRFFGMRDMNGKAPEGRRGR
jgi:Protein of unknown function (DUF2924)